MSAAPGDSLEFGLGSAAERGERSIPGALKAFKDAYATDPARADEVGAGVFSLELASPAAVVLFARQRNKVAILAVKEAGARLSRGDLAYLSALAAILRGER